MPVRRKFTPEQVRKVRLLRLLGHTYSGLAREFGVAVTTISFICKGYNYAHVPKPVIISQFIREPIDRLRRVQ